MSLFLLYSILLACLMAESWCGMKFFWRQLDFLFLWLRISWSYRENMDKLLNKALLNYSKATQSKFNSIQDQLLLINCKILIHPSNTHTIPYKKALQNQKKNFTNLKIQNIKIIVIANWCLRSSHSCRIMMSFKMK